MFRRFSLFRKTNSPKEENPQAEELNWEQLKQRAQRFPKWFQYLSLTFVVVVLSLMVNTFYRASTSSIDFPEREQMTMDEQIDLLNRIDSKDKKSNNEFSLLKRKALDSLIDNNIFTVENIMKIDSLYPDSLCDCL